MKDEAVCRLARQAGIAVDWIDAADRPQKVSMASLRSLLTELQLPCSTANDLGESSDRLRRLSHERTLWTVARGKSLLLGGARAGAAELVLEDGTRRPLTLSAAASGARVPPIDLTGYHRLRFGAREVSLAVAPARCFALADLAQGRRLWGLAVQLYSLRRAGDLGVGDTTALKALAEVAGRHGADALAISPMHSLFPSDPDHYSPYSPSNRRFLNPLLVDPADALGQDRVAKATVGTPTVSARLIDWPGAACAKFHQLRTLFADFCAHDLPQNTRLAQHLRDFVHQRGAPLLAHAQFEARQDREAGVDYFLFLQWIADCAVAAAQAAARSAGMRIGLISDLAVGVDRTGSEVASNPADFLGGLNLGAPPDAFNPKGQDWGLTSFSPLAFGANGFEPFIAILRANLRHAGGLRIDHAMGLMRLWLVPRGSPASEGAYLAYPFEDLMRLLALESHRHRAVIIGEDLGTVPAGFRARCRAAGVAGMDVLWFQRDKARFLPTAAWRDDAVAMTTTHDLPTVAGWWQGADLELRHGLGLAGDDDAVGRRAERAMLWKAFAQSGPAPAPNETASAVDAAIEFVAKSPDPLALVPLEDLMGSVEQPNLPGTVDEHPNWRHRFSLPADHMLDDPTSARRMDILKTARP